MKKGTTSSSWPAWPGKRTALSLLMGSIAIVGCDSSDNDTDPVNDVEDTDNGNTASNDVDDATPPADDQARALTGTWFYCTGAGLESTYVFEGRFEQYLANFADADCGGEPLQEAGLPSPFEPFNSGVYTLGVNVTADSGMEAVELDFSVTNVLGNEAMVPLNTYTILSFISPAEFVMPFARGTTPQTRPLTLDFDAVYRRTE